MKLRLGLFTADLAHQFGISVGLCTQIFYSWIRGMSEYLNSFIYMPVIETVLATSPKSYKSFNNLIGIIDCSEIFFETIDVSRRTFIPVYWYEHPNSGTPRKKYTFL